MYHTPWSQTVFARKLTPLSLLVFALVETISTRVWPQLVVRCYVVLGSRLFDAWSLRSRAVSWNFTTIPEVSIWFQNNHRVLNEITNLDTPGTTALKIIKNKIIKLIKIKNLLIFNLTYLIKRNPVFDLPDKSYFKKNFLVNSVILWHTSAPNSWKQRSA